MANLDLIKKRLQQLQSKGGSGHRDRKLKIEAGETQVRIVPYLENKDNPFIELYFHYDINNRTYVSPMSNGDADPMYELAQELYQTGDEEDKQMANKLRPKLRFYAPVVVRGKENEGVKYWGFSKTIYEGIVGYMSDPDYGDITDVMTGRDIIIEKQAKKPGSSDYSPISFRIKPKETPLADTKEEIASIVKNQVSINDVFPVSTYDDLKQSLEKWLGGLDDGGAESESQKTLSTRDDNRQSADTIASKQESDVSNERPEVKKQEPEDRSTKLDNVSSAFDDLFGDDDTDIPF